MKIGVMMHMTDSTVTPAVLAVEAEQRGFESVFVTEHTHIPVRPFIEWRGGEAMPELRSAARLQVDEAEWLEGASLAVVPFDLPGKAQRVNITIDSNLLKRVDHAAQVAGQSRSGFIASAVSQKMAGGR